MDEMVKLKKSETQHRWQTAIKDKAFNIIRHLPILETRPEHFLRVLEIGKVSTNVYLRRIHNFALDMTWLPWPVIVKRQWPKVQFKDKRAITWEEHQTIVARELNPERKAFYQLAWHLGASQTDLACLEAENIDWEHNVISFARRKTGSIAIMRFDDEMAEILRDLPGSGPLFPYLRTVRSGDRATEFHQRCAGLGIKGVTLHSYRYAWAERAKKAGYPERFAQEALGHNSKAIHRAYLMQHAEDLVPVMYDHARMLAIRKYGWREGKTLPLGKTPEDIVREVYVSYISGAGTEGQRIKGMRHFNPAKDFMLQLKGSIRSALWALTDKSSTKNEILARTEEDAARPVEFGSTEATPAESADSADFAKAVVEAVNEHPKIKSSQDLQDLIAAFELDATEVEEQAEMLGKKNEQITQLRYQLRVIILEVIKELNKD